ncbi:D-alanyl-D-alanine carboxypeptidase family protein [Nitratireductor pacificus]|uniref:serine-type D-Ala-D-Ala carboxypeptidase n=1 Tax=Nitratireductor pacificus pht-3B TaxID=391937 RepID=K2LKR6_9HYPH|nr:D-alanyl-D-alanine carboxypeptidase family protein [Nitratireductor pacificus]EKF18349.1 serine-type D-Ala-D-Ala carboxypeptidase [Nitratireductor pacificus pht-3B]
MVYRWNFNGLLAAALVVLLFGAQSASAQLFETRAKQAFMIDAETGTVLFSKEADARIPPASLAKLMTMEVVFNAIKSGRLTLNDAFYVSEHAWRTGGAISGTSTMFAEIKSSVPLEALIQAVIVQSANDGCIIIAEGMAGSEENFARLMTERARTIGLTDSVFVNATGLPAEGQHVTMRDLVRLSAHIWREYPEFYKYYAQEAFTWNKILQRNRNPLLRMDIGAEGMKTGFTEETGYAIVGAVHRGDRRLFVAMSGLSSESERAEEARKMLDWGIRAFERTEIFAAGETIGRVSVFGGEQPDLALRAEGPIAIFKPITEADRLVARIVYQGPVPAPVAAGTRIGTLKVWIGDTLSQETPLYAAEDVAVGTLSDRAMDAVGELLVGWLRKYRS